MSGGPITVIGGCHAAGATTVALAMALSSPTPITVMDADPRAGVMARLADLDDPRAGRDLVRVGAEATPTHVRAAAYPHPHLGALIPAPRGCDDADVRALVAHLHTRPDMPALVIDVGSGPDAAERVCEAARVVFVVSRDTLGVALARETYAALPRPSEWVLVVNDGVRRDDVGAAALARSWSAPRWLHIPRGDRDAQRVAVGHPPAARGAFGRACMQAWDTLAAPSARDAA